MSSQLLPALPITMGDAYKSNDIHIYTTNNDYKLAYTLARSLIETDDYNFFKNNYSTLMRYYVFAGQNTSSEIFPQTLFQLALCNGRFKEAQYILTTILPATKRPKNKIELERIQEEYNITVNFYFDFVHKKLVGLADTIIRMSSIEQNVLEALQYLHKVGANITLLGFNNVHPIVSAIFRGYTTVVNFYLTTFPEIKTQIVNGGYIVHHAIAAYNPYMIKLLIDRGVDISIHKQDVIDKPLLYAKRKITKYYDTYNMYKREGFITGQSSPEVILGLGIIIDKIANTHVIIRILESGGI